MRLIVALAFLIASGWASACLDAPLPTSPIGPTWEAELDDSTFSTTRIAQLTMWRQPCDDGPNLLLATIDPEVGSPFICSSSFQVVQGGSQYDNFRLRQDPSSTSSFCNNLLVKTTFAIGQFSTSPQWDTDSSFMLVWETDTTLDVGPFNPTDYGQEFQPPLHGSMSGSWFDPSRSGEGFVLDFGEIPDGPVASIYWFTHRDGVPYWLIGSTPYDVGQTEITFELVEFSGTGFGVEFDPDELDSEVFGVLNLEFESCSTGSAIWESLDGESGTFDLIRITAGIHGASCQ